jgi:hypothetical protein
MESHTRVVWQPPKWCLANVEMRITIELGIPSWARAWQRRMIDVARLFRRFWFPVLMALWLDVIFVERLVVDYRLWLHAESDGWNQAMSHPRCSWPA